MKSKLALGSAPAVSTPFLAAGVTSPTSLLSVFLHHRPKRIDAGGQAEPIEACGHLVPSFAHSPSIRRSQGNRCCANSLHGVAFLSWNRHPEPTGSRRATPLLLFQHSPGQSLLTMWFGQRLCGCSKILTLSRMSSSGDSWRLARLIRQNVATRRSGVIWSVSAKP